MLSPLTWCKSDIGHVDFLDAVSQLSEKPYVIVGLHFDQVSWIQKKSKEYTYIFNFLG